MGRAARPLCPIGGIDRMHGDSYCIAIVVITKDRSATAPPVAIGDIDAAALVPEAWLRTRQRCRRNFVIVLASLVVASGAAIAGLLVTGALSPSHGTLGTPAVVARMLCKSAFGGRALNSAPVSVKKLRTSIPGGPERTPPLRNAFRGAPSTSVAAWCWTGRPQKYRLYAVVNDYPPHYFEGVAGLPFTTTPAPGPAAIP